jgi:hypothetical protein
MSLNRLILFHAMYKLNKPIFLIHSKDVDLLVNDQTYWIHKCIHVFGEVEKIVLLGLNAIYLLVD